MGQLPPQWLDVTIAVRCSPATHFRPSLWIQIQYRQSKTRLVRTVPSQLPGEVLPQWLDITIAVRCRPHCLTKLRFGVRPAVQACQGSVVRTKPS